MQRVQHYMASMWVKLQKLPMGYPVVILNIAVAPDQSDQSRSTPLIPSHVSPKQHAARRITNY